MFLQPFHIKLFFQVGGLLLDSRRRTRRQQLWRKRRRDRVFPLGTEDKATQPGSGSKTYYINTLALSFGSRNCMLRHWIKFVHAQCNQLCFCMQTRLAKFNNSFQTFWNVWKYCTIFQNGLKDFKIFAKKYLHKTIIGSHRGYYPTGKKYLPKLCC